MHSYQELTECGIPLRAHEDRTDTAHSIFLCGGVRSLCNVKQTPHRGKLIIVQLVITYQVRCAVKNHNAYPQLLRYAISETIWLGQAHCQVETDCLSWADSLLNIGI